MAELPRGAVTFLFTDIEGSTQLVKRLRDRYPEVLAEHQRLLREAFAQHGGHEIDTQGDAFFFVFASAREAVLAAVEGQRSLAGHDWPEGADVRVRMGIHTGQAAPVDGRYSGVAVHRAARVSAAGHGGQILVSQTTHNLLEDEEEEIPGLALRDLGEQRLKDLDRPVRLYQVDVEGREAEFPPLRTEAPSPAAEPERRGPRRRTLLAGALAGVIAAAVAIPIFALGGGGGSGTALGDVGENALGVVDVESGDVRGAIDAPAAPSAVAVGVGVVWVASADANAVYAIDPTTNTVRDTIPVENEPGGIAVGGGSVWVTNSLAGTVSQISASEPYDVLETISVGNGPTGIAVGHGFVWVSNTTDHTVSKIRASTGRLLKTYAAGSDPGAIALGEGAVWVADKSTGTVTKLSRSGETLKNVDVGEGPAAVAVGAGAVWVANNLSGTVSKIDPATGEVMGVIQVGAGPTGIAVAGGDVWVANELSGTVSRIDPATQKPTTIPVGGRPTAIAPGNGVVYVTVRPAGTSHRGGTLVVTADADANLTSIDPAVAYSIDLWRLLSLTNDGLLTYRRAAGQGGYQLVPDLARSMPVVSEDGTTYTFQLRPNIRYSTGRVVRASDFRYSAERVFQIRPKPEPGAMDNFRAVRGAGRCTPKRCDLSKGIVADDASGTVTFHLRAPDSDFLYKLASTFAAVVPAGTTLEAAKRRPLPATGPYRIASFISNRSLRLVRNPRFRQWSSAAQPQGFPDEFVLKVVRSTKRRIGLVEDGRADLTSSIFESLRVAPAFRSQLHGHLAPNTVYLAFNPNKPPFDNVRARQAINYAVDRERVVELAGGEEAARPTCQVLPPNFPGYSRYCPYTLDPSADGSWTAPDAAKAARLVKASGTAGMEVTLWFPQGWQGAPGRYYASLLESLGYRVRFRSAFCHTKAGKPCVGAENVEAYFDALTGGATPPQIMVSGWFSDYPAASNFIDLLFSCSSTFNFGDFCDRGLARKSDAALKLQARDPASAGGLWAEVDHEIVDKAAWVPLYNTYGSDFVSKRVGNYQYHPQYGPLLSQMWVR